MLASIWIKLAYVCLQQVYSVFSSHLFPAFDHYFLASCYCKKQICVSFLICICALTHDKFCHKIFKVYSVRGCTTTLNMQFILNKRRGLCIKNWHRFVKFQVSIRCLRCIHCGNQEFGGKGVVVAGSFWLISLIFLFCFCKLKRGWGGGDLRPLY